MFKVITRWRLDKSYITVTIVTSTLSGEWNNWSHFWLKEQRVASKKMEKKDSALLEKNIKKYPRSFIKEGLFTVKKQTKNPKRT